MKKEKNKTKNTKSTHRTAEFVSNIDSIAIAFNCSENEVVDKVLERLNSSNMIKHFALIVHDKDIDPENGELKAPHIHITLVLKYPATFETIASIFGMPATCIQKIMQKKPYGRNWVSDVGGALSYLTHRNDKSKHQYSDDEVIASEDWDWKAERAQSEVSRMTSDSRGILERIKDGVINESNLTNAIDLNTYINNKEKIDKAMQYRQMATLNEHSRNIVCIYIFGPKGTGKTSLAKDFCERKELTYFITGGSKDPFQGYGGQDVVILDDIRPDAFKPEEWLKILDNNTKSLVSARYRNKDVTASYIILTSTVSIYNFFDEYKSEDAKQLHRRIKLYIVLNKEHIHYYEYKSQEEDYTLIKNSPNYILEKFGNPDLTDEQKEDLFEGFKAYEPYEQPTIFDFFSEEEENNSITLTKEKN